MARGWLDRVRLICLVVLAALALAGATELVLLPGPAGDPAGCHWADAMLPNIDCPQEALGGMGKLALNLPILVLVYSWALPLLALIWGHMPPTLLLTARLAGLVPFALGLSVPVGWLLRRRGGRR